MAASNWSNVDFGVPNVIIAKTGSPIKKNPIERIKCNPGQEKRFAILDDEFIAFYTHYYDGIGFVPCDGGECCRHGVQRVMFYVFPIVEYKGIDQDANIVNLSKIEFSALSLTEKQYDKYFGKWFKDKGSLKQFDYKMSCEKKGVFKEYSYREVGETQWKNDPKNREFMVEQWKKKPYILDGIVRKNLVGDVLKLEIQKALERAEKNSQEKLGTAQAQNTYQQPQVPSQNTRPSQRYIPDSPSRIPPQQQQQQQPIRQQQPARLQQQPVRKEEEKIPVSSKRNDEIPF